MTAAPAGSTFAPKTSRFVRGRRHLLLAIAKRLDGADRIANLPPLSKRSASDASNISSNRLSMSSSLPFKKQPRPLDGAFVIDTQMLATHGAMQRLMSYSRHGRLRSPVMTSLHERMPNSRCVSPMVLRANRAGMNGPA